MGNHNRSTYRKTKSESCVKGLIKWTKWILRVDLLKIVKTRKFVRFSGFKDKQ